MSILVDKNTRLIVQGITGREGAFHAGQMLAYGTNVVGGVTPGRGGQEVHGVPVFNTVREAVETVRPNASIIFVPPAFAAEAILEAAENGIELIVAITEGIPVQDMIETVQYVRSQGVRLIGPNCPGLISAEKALVGILPGRIFKEGPVGMVSRSGTLTY
ncbi:MAG: CoA-binding protein, partial [Limnochordales bacterium]